MRNTCRLIFFSLIFGVIGFAQEPTPGGKLPSGRGVGHPNEAFVGYLWEPTDWGALRMHGVEANYTRFIGTRWGAIADFDWSHGNRPTDAATYSYRFGPRFNLIRRPSRVQPYLDFLVGGGHLDADVSYNSNPGLTRKSWYGFTWAAGGGADVRLCKHWGARVSADWTHVPFGTHDSSSWKRVAFGAFYRW